MGRWWRRTQRPRGVLGRGGILGGVDGREGLGERSLGVEEVYEGLGERVLGLDFFFFF